jgi:hypothetical protein
LISSTNTSVLFPVNDILGVALVNVADNELALGKDVD